MKLLLIRDCYDEAYDLLYGIPEDMSDSMAVALANNAVREVRHTNPNDYTVEQLNQKLVPRGFQTVEYVKATEKF